MHQFSGGIRLARLTLLFALTTLVMAGSARAQLPLEVLHRFPGDTNPSRPQSPLIQGADGYLYGTTSRGGTYGRGTVFRTTLDGQVTVLHSFAGGQQGSEPGSGVIQARDGNFYGTTVWGGGSSACGGTLGCGTVFRMTPQGTLTQLRAFSGTTDGQTLYAGLVEANDGNLYGVATQGGAHGKGTVFRITPAGAFTVLHAFDGMDSFFAPPQPGNIDGALPYARLIQAADGSLYGTTFYGGANRVGSVFRISLDGTITTLHSFGPADGALPETGLVQASDGNFYGATTAGYVAGSVLYRMTPAGSVTVLHNLSHRDFWNDSPLIQASDGQLYGVTQETNSGGGFGAIFRLTLSGTFDVVHPFTFDEGFTARGPLLQAADGHLYGTTGNGGTGAQNGTIFRSSLGGSFTVLYAFMAGPEGGFPTGELFQAADQSFYGTTGSGGIFGRGTVYRTSPGGATTTVYSFGHANGRPEGGLIQGSDGNLYGATGGGSNEEAIWRLTPGGAFSVLHTFSGGADGASPNPLIQAADGNLYGTTRYANLSVTSGTVFRITPSGLFTTLHTFSGGDGATPSAALVQGVDGNFYGTTFRGGGANRGTVFRMTPAGAVTVLHAFNGLIVISDDDTGQFISSSGDPGDGAVPHAALIQATDGSFYGTTREGGARGAGVLFRITPQGQFTLLHSFGAPGDGIYPSLPLVQAIDGAFYGTTPVGGVHGRGTIFRMPPGGAVTVLHSFTGGADGEVPLGGLTQGRDGYLYGSTSRAGRGGQVFRFLPGVAFAPRILFWTPAAGGGLELTWAVDGAGPFTIVRTGGAAGQTILATGVTGNRFTDRTVVAGVVYSYVVIATPAGSGRVSSAPMSVPWLSPVSRTPTVTMVGDYDGDGKADLTVYRQSTGEWFSHRSADGALGRSDWGSPLLRDRPVPADYDGDGVTELAVYRQTTAEWIVHRSSDGGLTQLAWGAPALGDLPVPADYDGDGRADIAVYRATTGEWLIRRSTTSALSQLSWGSPALGDVPVPADYDGDGQADLAVYRATTGEWFIRRSTTGALDRLAWGSPALGDVPVPADYDADQKSDLAIYRAVTGEWLIRRSSDGLLVQFGWGAPALGDVPVTGDYDADGRADVAVYRESTGEWFIRTFDGVMTTGHWGAPSLGDAVRQF